MFGHFFAAVVGVGITKLFFLLPPDRFENVRWVAGALAVGVASILMSFSKTVHPPAGATALLAATNAEIQVLGWWLLPLVLLASMLMLASACVVNNGLGRRFPVYWWTPVDLKALRDGRRMERLEKRGRMEGDVELGGEKKGGEDLSEVDSEPPGSNIRKEMSPQADSDARVTRAMSYSSADRIPRRETETREEELKIGQSVVEGRSLLITKHKIIVPESLQLTDWEDEVLRILMERMRDGHGRSE